MTSTELMGRQTAPPVARRSATTVERLLDFEADCYATALRWYLFLVDVAPILVKYEAKQLWCDVKCEFGDFFNDVLDVLS